VYLRNLLVVVLCTAFVVGFVLALDYATAGVGKQGQTTLFTTQTTSCTAPASTCIGFSITSTRLVSMNYTDVLGPGNYAILTLGLNASGGPISSVRIFVDNQSAGMVQGPFQPGVNRILNLTLPATITVSPGKLYAIGVEGYFGTASETIWMSVRVVSS
jgi:hypothetical protein